MSHVKYYNIERWEQETGEVNRSEKVTYVTDEDAVRYQQIFKFTTKDKTVRIFVRHQEQ